MTGADGERRWLLSVSLADPEYAMLDEVAKAVGSSRAVEAQAALERALRGDGQPAYDRGIRTSLRDVRDYIGRATHTQLLEIEEELRHRRQTVKGESADSRGLVRGTVVVLTSGIEATMTRTTKNPEKIEVQTPDGVKRIVRIAGLKVKASES